MFKRFYVGAALGGAALLLAGCGGSPGPETNPPPVKGSAGGTLPEKKPEKQAEVKEAPKAVGLQVVTLHVKDMTERMKLV